jgi:hypothetical protein
VTWSRSRLRPASLGSPGTSGPFGSVADVGILAGWVLTKPFGEYFLHCLARIALQLSDDGSYTPATLLPDAAFTVGADIQAGLR